MVRGNKQESEVKEFSEMRTYPEGTNITIIANIYSALTRCLTYFCKPFHILSHFKWDPGFLTTNLFLSLISDKFTLLFSWQNHRLCDQPLHLSVCPVTT